MTAEKRKFDRALRLATLCGLAALAFMPAIAAAFNPDEGAVETSKKTSSSQARQPSKTAAPTPLRIVFPDSSTPRQVPVENPSVASAPTMSGLPPVDPVIAQKAANELATSGYLAPGQAAPVPPMPLAQQTVQPEPLGPVTANASPASGPAPSQLPKIAFPQTAPSEIQEAPLPLTDASKKILSNIPSKLDAASKPKSAKMDITRMSPEIKALVDNSANIESFDSVGMSIKVQRPGLDSNFELNRAYVALMAGDSSTAVSIYKNIISTEPTNEDALFGLAATYHRLGELDKARPFYAQLLKVNPQHREGLNNFLALVSDESPQEALAELERLEQRNPEFSPIPAQQAVVLTKLGFTEQAREKMFRAIELSPENLTYKYNLAVMLDKQGLYTDASALYRLLIDASLKGQPIPASIETLQKRLNFLTTATAPRGTVGG